MFDLCIVIFLFSLSPSLDFLCPTQGSVPIGRRSKTFQWFWYYKLSTFSTNTLFQLMWNGIHLRSIRVRFPAFIQVENMPCDWIDCNHFWEGAVATRRKSFFDSDSYMNLVSFDFCTKEKHWLVTKRLQEIREAFFLIRKKNRKMWESLNRTGSEKVRL